MAQLIELPNGAIAEFPDNMEPAAIEAVLQKQFPSTKMGAAEAAWEGGKQGLTLGFGDEASAAISAGMTKATDFIDDLIETDEEKRMRLAQGEFYEPEKRQSYSELYTQERDRQRAEYQKALKDQPTATVAGELAGGMLTVAPGVSAAKGGIQLAKQGAKIGGAYGLGSSEADLTKGEYKEAAKDTAIGATVGAVAPSVAKGIVKGAKSAGALRKLAQKHDLLPSNVPEAIAQIIGHNVAPGFGGVVAQKALKIFNNINKIAKKRPLTSKETSALAKAETDLGKIAAKAEKQAANLKAKRDAYLKRKQAEANKK